MNVHFNEWDSLAETRYEQIISGNDITYQHIILPNILELTQSGKRIVDIGCGIGVATSAVSKAGNFILGIDPSIKSIHVARRTTPGIRFECSSAQDFYSTEKFDTALLNMVLHNTSSPEEVINSAKRLIHSHGEIVVSICDPDEWPVYKSLDVQNENRSCQCYRIPFTITNDQNAVHETSYYHRSRDWYLSLFDCQNLIVLDERSPMPSSNARQDYGFNWRAPRIWFVKLGLA